MHLQSGFSQYGSKTNSKISQPGSKISQINFNKFGNVPPQSSQMSGLNFDLFGNNSKSNAKSQQYSGVNFNAIPFQNNNVQSHISQQRQSSITSKLLY